MKDIKIASLNLKTPPLTPNEEYQAITPVWWSRFENFFISSSWLFLFLLLCYELYAYSARKIDREYEKLSVQYRDLMEEKEKALKINADYLLQINSQSDQDWVELTLMKVLGLVPEEQVKVFFPKSE